MCVCEQLWISKLPKHLQPQLRMEDGDLATKGAKADRGVDTLSMSTSAVYAATTAPQFCAAASAPPASAASFSAIEQLIQNQNRLIEMMLQQHQGRAPRSQSPRRNQRRDPSNGAMKQLVNGVCGYHTKFGQAAYRCAPGCQLPKN